MLIPFQMLGTMKAGKVQSLMQNTTGRASEKQQSLLTGQK